MVQSIRIDATPMGSVTYCGRKGRGVVGLIWWALWTVLHSARHLHLNKNLYYVYGSSLPKDVSHERDYVYHPFFRHVGSPYNQSNPPSHSLPQKKPMNWHKPKFGTHPTVTHHWIEITLDLNYIYISFWKSLNLTTRMNGLMIYWGWYLHATRSHWDPSIPQLPMVGVAPGVSQKVVCHCCLLGEHNPIDGKKVVHSQIKIFTTLDTISIKEVNAKLYVM